MVLRGCAGRSPHSPSRSSRSPAAASATTTRLPGGKGAAGDDEKAAEQLGLPAHAPRATRSAWPAATPAADAAGVASALFPATSEADRPTAVVLVDRSDWQCAIAASVLAGPPIGAPILLSDGDSLPAVTADTLDQLKPRGSDLSKDAQVIRIGDGVARPSGYKTAVIEGDDAYERAAAVDRFFSAARGRPSTDVVLYSGEDAEWAMPAAAWAARSGNAALPVERDSIPDPIKRALREHERPNVYVLGPERAISNKVVVRAREGPRRLGQPRVAGRPRWRTRSSSPATARATSAGAWRCRATTSRWRAPRGRSTPPPPRRSATRGVFAPLLLTDQAADAPARARELLPERAAGLRGGPRPGGLQPRLDPRRRRTWCRCAAQARLDRITELIPVQATAP